MSGLRFFVFHNDLYQYSLSQIFVHCLTVDWFSEPCSLCNNLSPIHVPWLPSSLSIDFAWYSQGYCLPGSGKEVGACKTWVDWLWQAYWWSWVGYGISLTIFIFESLSSWRWLLKTLSTDWFSNLFLKNYSLRWLGLSLWLTIAEYLSSNFNSLLSW